jgi:hypothetical protein
MAYRRRVQPTSFVKCGPVEWNVGLLPQLQDDHLQSRDVGKVLGVGREQPETTLNGLCRKPEVVHANAWISSRLSEFCGQAPERLGRFDRDSQLGLSPESSKHGSRALLPRTGPQQFQTEPDFGDVDGREIDWLLPSKTWISAAARAPRSTAIQGWYRSPSPRISQLRNTPTSSLPLGGNGGQECFRRLVTKRPIKIAKHAQRILSIRFGDQPRDMPLIAHEHDLFLVAFERVENSAEVACDVGHRQRLHAIRLSD